MSSSPSSPRVSSTSNPLRSLLLDLSGAANTPQILFFSPHVNPPSDADAADPPISLDRLVELSCLPPIPQIETVRLSPSQRQFFTAPKRGASLPIRILVSIEKGVLRASSPSSSSSDSFTIFFKGELLLMSLGARDRVTMEASVPTELKVVRGIVPLTAEELVSSEEIRKEFPRVFRRCQEYLPMEVQNAVLRRVFTEEEAEDEEDKSEEESGESEVQEIAPVLARRRRMMKPLKKKRQQKRQRPEEKIQPDEELPPRQRRCSPKSGTAFSADSGDLLERIAASIVSLKYPEDLPAALFVAPDDNPPFPLSLEPFLLRLLCPHCLRHPKFYDSLMWTFEPPRKVSLGTLRHALKVYWIHVRSCYALSVFVEEGDREHANRTFFFYEAMVEYIYEGIILRNGGSSSSSSSSSSSRDAVIRQQQQESSGIRAELPVNDGDIEGILQKTLQSPCVVGEATVGKVKRILELRRNVLFSRGIQEILDMRNEKPLVKRTLGKLFIKGDEDTEEEGGEEKAMEEEEDTDEKMGTAIASAEAPDAPSPPPPPPTPAMKKIRTTRRLCTLNPPGPLDPIIACTLELNKVAVIGELIREGRNGMRVGSWIPVTVLAIAYEARMGKAEMAKFYSFFVHVRSKQGKYKLSPEQQERYEGLMMYRNTDPEDGKSYVKWSEGGRNEGSPVGELPKQKEEDEEESWESLSQQWELFKKQQHSV